MLYTFLHFIAVFLLVFGCVVILRDLFSFIWSFVKATPIQFTTARRIVLALSLAYVFSSIFVGLPC
jgi:hypothetical protein